MAGVCCLSAPSHLVHLKFAAPENLVSLPVCLLLAAYHAAAAGDAPGGGVERAGSCHA
jgi:hypothetical protein